MADRRELHADLETALRLVCEQAQSQLWTALPCVITKYDAAAGTCEAKPTIKCKRIDEKGAELWVAIPLLVDVPVIFPSGGGFTLTFPVQPEDECLVVFSSRCIDAWWSLGPGALNDPGQVQTEMRMHDLSDGFAIVGPRSRPNVLNPTASTTAVELRNDNRTARVSIDASANITLQTTGNLQATASGQATVTAPTINLTGNVVITGTLTASGLITAPAAALAMSLTVAGLEQATHVHNKNGSAAVTLGPQAP